MESCVFPHMLSVSVWHLCFRTIDSGFEMCVCACVRAHVCACVCIRMWGAVWSPSISVSLLICLNQTQIAGLAQVSNQILALGKQYFPSN